MERNDFYYCKEGWMVDETFHLGGGQYKETIGEQREERDVSCGMNVT